MDLRDYQQAFVDDATAFLRGSRPGDKRLYAAPTGTGKSLMELTLLERFPDLWLVTPWIEVIVGMVSKLGLEVPYSLDMLAALAWDHRITTPLRLRNALLQGVVQRPKYLCFDEGHHHEAETYQLLEMLTGCAAAIALTATPFRGTPKSTADFRKTWGQPVDVLTYPEAAQLGYLKIPECRTVPLVDDDYLEISGYEFVVKSVEAAVADKLDHVQHLARAWYSGGLYDLPTMYALPSRRAAAALAERLVAGGLPAVIVDSDSSFAARQEAFSQTLARTHALCQVRVVSEGVDLPLGRLVDLAPHLSPVAWLQQFGRITRPGGPREYVCCNRNLMRHAYLLEGCLPPADVAEAQEAFQGPGKRAASRVVGLESLGRLKPVELPLRGGLKGTAYSVAATEGARSVEFFVLIHPAKKEPIWATRVNAIVNGMRSYGRWARCEPPESLIGFASAATLEVSEKQAAWWKRAAASHGLDSAAKVTRKNFAALPVLCDLGIKV